MGDEFAASRCLLLVWVLTNLLFFIILRLFFICFPVSNQQKNSRQNSKKVKTAVCEMRIEERQRRGKKLARFIDTCVILLKEGSRVRFFPSSC